jgi:serine/threonine-protein kinase PknK
VITISVPALRQRPADIIPLARWFASKHREAGQEQVQITKAAERALLTHRWPGNIRELENVVAQAVALGQSVIDVEDLPAQVRQLPPVDLQALHQADLDLRQVVNRTEASYIQAALARSGNNHSEAARLLGLSRFGLQKKMQRLRADGALHESPIKAKAAPHRTKT